MVPPEPIGSVPGQPDGGDLPPGSSSNGALGAPRGPRCPPLSARRRNKVGPMGRTLPLSSSIQVTFRPAVSSHLWNREDVMFNWLMHRGLAAFERQWNYDASYVHEMVEADPRAA